MKRFGSHDSTRWVVVDLQAWGGWIRKFWRGLAVLSAGWAGVLSAASVTVATQRDMGHPAEFGMGRLEARLRSLGATVMHGHETPSTVAGPLVVAGLTSADSPAALWLRKLQEELPSGSESLVMARQELEGGPVVVLCGSDSRGLMYAALEAEGQLEALGSVESWFRELRTAAERPVMLERGVSIYTMHRAWFEQRLHDARHWERYFELLARSRINSFVIVFGYENGGFMAPPYPFFFPVPGFPEVEMVGLSPAEQGRNRAAFQRMIDLAHERGIEVIPAIWDHIYRGGVQAGGIAGASEQAGRRVPGLVYGVTTDNLFAYNQAAIREFLDVFPDIDGIQFRMHGESGLQRGEIEGFWHEIFRSIREKRPDLRVDLRAKELPDSVIEDGLAQGLRVRVATKYWMEQMGLPFHPTHVNPPNQHDRRHGYADLLRYPQRYAVHWRLWNGGTTRLLLWGDPDYVRRFVASAQLYEGKSFEVNEMLATWMLGEPHDADPRDVLDAEHRYTDYPFERYWHAYQLWGRLGYNPGTDTSVWERDFSRRFGLEPGRYLMNGLHEASRVLPRIVAASYPYRLFPTTRGWAEMMRMGDLPDYAAAEGSDVQQFQNMMDAADSLLLDRDTAMRTPAETSAWFHQAAGNIFRHADLAEQAARGPHSRELRSTLTDLRILAWLAKYHAERLPAGVAYNLYRKTGDLFALEEAIAFEIKAVKAWEGIVQAAGAVYSTNLAFGVERVGFPRHWRDELHRLKAGLQALRAEQSRALTQPPWLAHVPVRRLGVGDELRIRVTAGGVDGQEALVLQVEEDGGAYRFTGFRFAGPGRYEAVYLPETGSRRLAYRIESVDREGIRASLPDDTGLSAFNVVISDDREPPQIQLERPVGIQAGQDLPVTARIAEAGRLKWVRLRYRHLTQFEDYQTCVMTPAATRGLWEGSIPGSFIVPEWDLMVFVEAVDEAGNGRMAPDLETAMPYVVLTVERR